MFSIRTRIQTSTSVYRRLFDPSILNIQKSLKPAMPLSQKTPEEHAALNYTPPPTEVTNPQKTIPCLTPSPSPPHQAGLRQYTRAVRGAIRLD